MPQGALWQILTPIAAASGFVLLTLIIIYVLSVVSAVDSFIDAMPARFVTPIADAPALPDLKRLRQLGIPSVDDAEFDAALVGLIQRRRLLLALIRSDGWG